jgi:hypothetical protein
MAVLCLLFLSHSVRVDDYHLKHFKISDAINNRLEILQNISSCSQNLEFSDSCFLRSQISVREPVSYLKAPWEVVVGSWQKITVGYVTSYRTRQVGYDSRVNQLRVATNPNSWPSGLRHSVVMQ